VFFAIHDIATRSPVSPQSNVIITCNTPGLCWSDLLRVDIPKVLYAIYWLFMISFARSTEEGAYALVDAIRPDLGTDSHGEFLESCTIGT